MDNGNTPATKHDLGLLEHALKEDIGALRQEVKQDVGTLRQEVKQDIGGLRQGLKQDIGALRQELKQDIDMVRSEMQHVYDNLVERIADSETRLLQAFYSYAESNNKRMIQVEGNSAAFLNRIGALESRILEIEKRLNMPPTQ